MSANRTPVEGAWVLRLQLSIEIEPFFTRETLRAVVLQPGLFEFRPLSSLACTKTKRQNMTARGVAFWINQSAEDIETASVSFAVRAPAFANRECFPLIDPQRYPKLCRRHDNSNLYLCERQPRQSPSPSPNSTAGSGNPTVTARDTSDRSRRTSFPMRYSLASACWSCADCMGPSYIQSIRCFRSGPWPPAACVRVRRVPIKVR